MFPVRVSVMEELKKASREPDVGRDAGYYLNGKEVEFTKMTEEQIERYASYLYRMDTRYYVDWELYNIVAEEAGGFFSGSYDAERAAKNIQNRVQLYLWERQ